MAMRTLNFGTFQKSRLIFDHGSLDEDQHVCAGEPLVMSASTLNLQDGPLRERPGSNRNQHQSKSTYVRTIMTTLVAEAPKQKTKAPTVMKALVYQGPGKKALEERPMPASPRRPMRSSRSPRRPFAEPICTFSRATCRRVSPAAFSVTKASAWSTGRRRRHEFKPGDHVLISCISACGKCDYCRKGMYSHCTTGGWILGNQIDGTQAEYVRIPHADTSLYPIPEGADEEALVMLSDILPTGFECGVLNGKVQPGRTRGDRRRRADRSGRTADGAVLLAGRDHHDRPRRQPAGGGQAVRRDGDRQQQATARPPRR